jgi:hypothetical protein
VDKSTLENITKGILDSHARLGGIGRNLNLFGVLWCVAFCDMLNKIENGYIRSDIVIFSQSSTEFRFLTAR